MPDLCNVHAGVSRGRAGQSPWNVTAVVRFATWSLLGLLVMSHWVPSPQATLTAHLSTNKPCLHQGELPLFTFLGGREELLWPRERLLVPREGLFGLPPYPYSAQTLGAASTWTPGWAGSPGHLCSPAVQSKRKDINSPRMQWVCRNAGGQQESQGGGDRLSRAAEAQVSPKTTGVTENDRTP